MSATDRIPVEKFSPSLKNLTNYFAQDKHGEQPCLFFGSLTVSGKREKEHSIKNDAIKTTTRLQSSLDSTIESRFFSRVSIVQSRLVSDNRGLILTFETRFSQSSLISHNRVSFHTIESRFSQSSLVSHNRVSFHTIECIDAKGTGIESQRRKFTNGDWYRESIRENRRYGKR